jgi:hypothetical protein
MALANPTRDDPEAPAAHADYAANARAVGRFLGIEKWVIIEASVAALGRIGPHYQAAGPEGTRARLERLCDELTVAATSRDVGSIIRYAEELADARFFAGYDLSEIQAAFNTLEEAIWARIIAELRPEELAPALSIVSTILGAAKDALARRYVSLAIHTHTPTLDYESLSMGSGS